MQLKKFNYMGRYDNSVSIEDWFKEKALKAHNLARNPKDLPLYTLKPSQVNLKV
ncbi:hypothetical protein [Vibrio coralliirubri]|uniref:hypothetical protein n=1 Tax=Vibrio coralliirubri TaxID=1516159 RepID=UPI0012E0A55D|nr:hypothetical protein [Vibrio coralliirubri]